MNWPNMGKKMYVTALSAEERIRSLKSPISPRERDAALELIDTDVRLVEHELRRHFVGRLERRRVLGAFLGERYADTKLKRQQAEEDVARVDKQPRSIAMTILHSAGAVVAGACEFLVSWATLPQVLDIPRDSLMGVCISLSPVICFLLLKHPIDWFLHSAPHRLVMAFYAALTGGVVWMMVSMVVARNEVTRVIGVIVRGNLNVEFREDPINHFLLAVSTILVLAGAVLLSQAFRNGSAIVAALKARLKLSRLDHAERRLEKELGKAKMREAELQQELERTPQLMAEAWRHRQLVLLAGIKVSYPTADEIVSARLGLDPKLSSGTRLM